MKKNNFTLLCTCIVLILSLTLDLSAQSVKHSKAIEKEIDALFADYDKPNHPGAAIAVIKDGNLVYSKGYGSAQLEYDIPITPKTVFHAASLSKQFTAFSVLLLEEKGLLSMDDDIRKYIPEVPDFGHTITLRHLASHSSGLRDQWRLLTMAGWRLDDVITKEQIMKLVERQKALNFMPGDENLYSNTGFTLLAEVVERISGQSFAEFTKKNIFEPLNMTNTQFYDNHEKIVKNRAYSYKKTDDGYKKSILSYATVGPSSLFVTAEDFALWALNFENPKVGSKAIIEKLNTPPPLNHENEGRGFALGQFRGTYQGLNVFVHSGSDAGYKAYFGRVVDHGLSVVILGNVSTINPIEQVFGIVNLYLSDHFEETNSNSEERKTFEHDPNIFINLSKNELQQFEGDYWEPKEGYKRKIYVKNDTLMYYRSESSETKLVPIAKNEFKMLGDSENVSVLFNSNQESIKRMQVVINDRAPLDMLAFSEVNLEEYEGAFYSEELSTTYTFKVIEEALIAQHPRHEDIIFSPITKNLFNSKNRSLKTIKFVRNSANKVIGIKASNGRVRDLYFEKEKK